MRRLLGHVSFGAVVPFPAAAGDISLSSFRPVGAPLRGITGRGGRLGRGGAKNKKKRGGVPNTLIFFRAKNPGGLNKPPNVV